MSVRLPRPEDLPGLDRRAVIAVPAPEGLTLYRVISPAGPISASDFAPTSRRRAMGAPELLRVGLSHFSEPEQAAAIRRRPGRIVRVSVRGGHVARTGARAGHVTVWADPDDLAAAAEVVWEL